MTALTGATRLDTANTSRIVQLSDTHLMASQGGTLLGLDTDRSLAAVCRLLASLEPIDALLLTGDLAGDEADSAYQRLDLAVSSLGVPSFWLPGNHDAVWSKGHALSRYFKRSIHLPHWDVLMLNTQHSGAVAGYLDAGELEALQLAIAQAETTHRPLLVATHHPLLPVGSKWLDDIGVQNAAEALELLAVLGDRAVVVSGHVHQESAQVYQGVNCLTSPSTCVQFAPGSAEFQVDALAPGCRELTLSAGGFWETAVRRVSDEKFSVDLNSPGYA